MFVSTSVIPVVTAACAIDTCRALLQRLVAAGAPLAAAGLHGSRAPAACAAAERHRGLPLVDVRLHAHQLLFGRFLVAAAEEVSRLQAFTCRHLRPSLMTDCARGQLL